MEKLQFRLRFEEINKWKWRIVLNIPGVVAGYLVLEKDTWKFEWNRAAESYCSLGISQVEEVLNKLKQLSHINDTTPLSDAEQFEQNNKNSLFL
jgi:hypothetical protein